MVKLIPCLLNCEPLQIWLKSAPHSPGSLSWLPPGKGVWSRTTHTAEGRREKWGNAGQWAKVDSGEDTRTHTQAKTGPRSRPRLAAAGTSERDRHPGDVSVRPVMEQPRRGTGPRPLGCMGKGEEAGQSAAGACDEGNSGKRETGKCNPGEKLRHRECGRPMGEKF